MDKIYIGIDNGTSGSIGIIGPNGPVQYSTPKIMEQSYTKKAQNISRLDFKEFENILQTVINQSIIDIIGPKVGIIKVIFERPLVNPRMFKTTMSAMRCLEAELILVEQAGLSRMYLDSKAWQKELLPQGLKGSPALKKASMDIGIRLFPELEREIKKQKDADGILIAEYARRKNL